MIDLSLTSEFPLHGLKGDQEKFPRTDLPRTSSTLFDQDGPKSELGLGVRN